MPDYPFESSIPQKRLSLNHNHNHHHMYSNDILSELDSNIPTTASTQMSSSKKRQRLSLLPKNVTLGAPRLANQPSTIRRKSSFGLSQQPPSVQDLVQQSITRTSTSSIPNKRRSLANNNNNNNNAINSQYQYQPPSSSGRLFDNSMINNTPQQPQPYRDPRPLRDRNYQLMIQDTLFEYLSTNKFDIEMKHQLTSKTLKNPTQKDFVLIFQWLFKKIDPGYKFVRTIEQEVYSLLKALDYPFLESVNKSQISAVGGSNWHVFLGMLYWLLGIAQESSNLDSIGLYGFQNNQLLQHDHVHEHEHEYNGDDSVDDSILAKDTDILEALYTKYTLKAYQLYLKKAEGNYDQLLKEFSEEYNKFSQEVAKKYQILDEENRTNVVKYQELESEYRLLSESAERAKCLESDVNKYKQFISQQNKKKSKWPTTIQKIKDDIENTKNQTHLANEEVKQIINDLARRGFTPEQIEVMQRERSQLSQRIDATLKRVEAQHELIEKQSTTLNKTYNNLESLIVPYNAAIQNYTDFGDLSELEIRNFNSSFIKDELKLGLKPTEMIPQISTLKTKLNELNSKLIDSQIVKSDEHFKLKKQYEELETEYSDVSEKVEEMEQSISEFESTFNELKEQFQIDESTKKNQYQRLERDKQTLESKFKEEKRKIESEFSEVQEEYQRITAAKEAESGLLVEKVSGAFNYAFDFKEDVMGSLAGFNKMIRAEIEDCANISSKFV